MEGTTILGWKIYTQQASTSTNMRHQILQKLKVQIILATNLIELFGKEEASNL
jgi:hypothetical protein